MSTVYLPSRRQFGLSLGAVGLLALAPRPGIATVNADDAAGTVARVKGSALAVRDAVPRILESGEQIFVGDILSTGKDSRLEIKMIDNGVFTLGERTSFVVLDYTFGGGGNAAFRLMTGAVNAVSGSLAKKTAGLRVETEVATIGIRGTKFWIGEMHGLMHVAHWNGGGVDVSNAAGRVLLKDKQTGTKIKDGATAPTPSEPWPDMMSAHARAMTAF